MKISFNWLKQYIFTELPADKVAVLLTNCGLEVESVEKFETVKGGLAGCIIGEVKTKEKHPDADKLSLTTVDIGSGTLLNIVCGASNVAAGQKVIVAMVGATIYPSTGEPITLKKAKIRGAISEGMICAEDELGLGTSHEGILVLDPSSKVGTPASEYFKIEVDHVFEIGLTPNRADAASHTGVARDLAAVLQLHFPPADPKPELSEDVTDEEVDQHLDLPSVNEFAVDSTATTITVAVEDAIACPRYSGISVSGITVGNSPAWLKNRLAAIGLRSINNIVDVTNYVLHELGQPLHAFDADTIKGKKVLVKKLPSKTKFKTLDGTERELTADDLMICDAEKGMCIAGVFGGMESGVTSQTKNIFLESAYFDAVHIRKTAKHHGLKTDASFRYERGADPNITLYALKRAALLIKEIAGGKISSEIIDIYPKAIEPFKVAFSYTNCQKLIGKDIPHETIKNILLSLGIEIISEGGDALLLAVPPFKVDVQREADVVEEVLRIYGYNNIELPETLHASLSFSIKPDPEKLQDTIATLLGTNGFNEILTNSLTKGDHYADKESETVSSVKILNPLSTDLNVMRQSLLFTGLEAIAYNINRKNSDLKFFEFGKTYLKANGKYIEEKHLSLFMTGRYAPENWGGKNEAVQFFHLKSAVTGIAERLGHANIRAAAYSDDSITQGLSYSVGKRSFAIFGKLKREITKNCDVKQDVYYADLNWDVLLSLTKHDQTIYKEVSKFPEVRRDLALLVDKKINYEQLEQLAYQTEKALLKQVNLFDIYEGEKIEKGKKSYALSFILRDDLSTLTDKQIEKVMEKLQKAFEEKAGASIRN